MGTSSVRFVSDLSGLRHGDRASAKSLTNTLLLWYGLELHSRAIVGSAKVSWVVDIWGDHYLLPGFLSILDSELRRVNAVQASLDDWLESGRRTLMYFIIKSCMCHKWQSSSAEEVSESSIPSYAVVVSALVLLSLVYHYLTGNVDRGGSKAYSRSSLDFRDIYVAIVLFQGAYVWIKFREAAFRGVHRRELPGKQGSTKVVYEARLKPPKWNGEQVRRLDLGQFATPQEARNKFRIAAFYYDRDAGLLDGWFQVPPMGKEEQSLTGKEKRRWVLGQAKKVYEAFKKEEAASLLQELLEVWDDQVTPEQDVLNVDFSMVSFLNSAEHQQPALASEAENSGMSLAVLDNLGLECAPHSFDGLHEGLALSNGHSLDFQEGSVLPVSRLPSSTETVMNLNGNDQLDLLQARLDTQQQQIYDQQQQLFLQQQQIQEFGAQILQLQHQRHTQQLQQLQESRIQNPQWPCQFCLQHQ